MTETRPSQPRRERPQADEQSAAAIGAAVASSASVSGVAPVILPMLPPPTLSLDGGRIAAMISIEVTEFALKDAPQLAENADADQIAEFYEELTYRGLYAISAAGRLAKAISKGATLEERRELLAKAVRAEKRYFEQHRDATRQRAKARQVAREAVDRWGEIVSWVHGNPKEPRPDHVAADGRNFRPADGPPMLTKVMPGVLPGCTCTIGPPNPGGTTMVGALRGVSDG